MKNYIYSTFDLSKSLKNFQEKVTKLLELTNISEWDGRVFREREKKIREFALIMAGECTALLLHNLSKSQEFLDKAEQQTRGWWQTTTQKHGCKKRQILTVGNIEVSLKLPYVVERQTQSKKNQKSLHEGFCPFLRYLGMSEGITPGVFSTIARYGAIAGSFEAARTTLINWGINISLKRIERLTYYFGKIGINLRESKITSLELGSGAVESLIRQVVNLRMKGNSKFWLQNNAEIMLHLRCQWIAKSWDNFSACIFNSFIKPQTA